MFLQIEILEVYSDRVFQNDVILYSHQEQISQAHETNQVPLAKGQCLVISETYVKIQVRPNP